jgi:HEAT repeat protein
VETRAPAPSLQAAIATLAGAQAGPFWIAYAMDSLPQTEFCESRSDTVYLEGERRMTVLARMENGAVPRLRTHAARCKIDAGGLPVTVFTGVSAADSLAWLESLARQPKREGSAIRAIAMHPGTAADSLLTKFLALGESEPVRRAAASNLFQRGSTGFDLARRVLLNDSSDGVREKAVTSLALSTETGAADALIAAARDDKSPRVRSQALFWLAERHPTLAERPLREAIERDPANETKRRAVFAVSRLPAGQGVPFLISLARSSKDQSIRREAVQWLARSKDSRAQTFLSDLLR